MDDGFREAERELEFEIKVEVQKNFGVFAEIQTVIITKYVYIYHRLIFHDLKMMPRIYSKVRRI